MSVECDGIKEMLRDKWVAGLTYGPGGRDPSLTVDEHELREHIRRQESHGYDVTVENDALRSLSRVNSLIAQRDALLNACKKTTALNELFAEVIAGAAWTISRRDRAKNLLREIQNDIAKAKKAAAKP